MPESASGEISRREFLAGAAALGLVGTASGALATSTAAAEKSAAPNRPVQMHVGHQHDHSDPALKLFAALGVNNICIGLPSPRMDENWSVDGLTALRKRVESFGIALVCVPL